MEQDYRQLAPDSLELLEKQTSRVLVQAVQEYSREARQIFETTAAASETEVIVLAEDLVQYALEVAEVYPINRRFAGFIDYKRVRWMPSPFGLFPQALLVDAKASTEDNRDTLQQSQLPMDAEFLSGGKPVTLKAGIPPYLEIPVNGGACLPAVTTSAFVHFHYKALPPGGARLRDLMSIYVLLVPHSTLKPRYNPDPETTFFGQGKHSPQRGEAQRIRVYFTRLRKMCPWRLQQLVYRPGSEYTSPVWRDVDPQTGKETESPFHFIGR